MKYESNVIQEEELKQTTMFGDVVTFCHFKVSKKSVLNFYSE